MLWPKQLKEGRACFEFQFEGTACQGQEGMVQEHEAGGGSQRIHSEKASSWCSVSSPLSLPPATSFSTLLSHTSLGTLSQAQPRVCVLGGATAIKVDSSDEPSKGD